MPDAPCVSAPTPLRITTHTYQFYECWVPRQSELACDSEKGKKAMRKKFGTYSKNFSTIFVPKKSRFFKRLIKIKQSECHFIGIQIAPYLK